MALAAALVVSNRLQRVAAAMLCLMAAQVFAVASCTPEPAPYAVRVAVTR